MGSFYTNVTLRGPARERVIAALEARGRTAYVGPTVNGCTVVFDSGAEDQDGSNEQLAAELSKELECPALAVTVHDDDILTLALARGGQVVDRYDSAPGYFQGQRSAPEGMDAALLAEAIGRRGASAERVEAVLRAPWQEEYLYETGRHNDLAEALGLPDYAVGVGYNYVYQGDAEELEDDLVHVGEQDDPGAGGFPGGMEDLAALLGGGQGGGMPDLRALMEGLQGAPGGGMQDLDALMKELQGMQGGGMPGLPGGGMPALSGGGLTDAPGGLPNPLGGMGLEGLGNLDLGQLGELAGIAGTLPDPMALMAMMEHPSARFFNALALGDVEAVRALFAGEARIDDPRAGRVEGDEALAAFVAASEEWLREAAAPHREMLRAMGLPAEMMMGVYQPLFLTQSPGRDVAEGILTASRGGRPVALPVASVWETAPEGGIGAVRVYHSLWPLRGEHTVRPPLVPPADGLEVPDVVGRYQAALAAGDVEAVVACFEPNGVAQEPSGGAHTHFGAGALRAFYASLFSAGGGIPLQHCTVTDDGVRCALEYVVTRWGAAELPPQAGVAVYERGPGGLLRAARIYDDVDPPSPSQESIS